MLEQSHRQLLQSLVKYPDIMSLDIIDFKNDEVSINIHACEVANEEEVLFLVGEIFSDIDFGEEVLFKDKNNGIATVVFSSEAEQNEYSIDINVYFKREMNLFDMAM